MRQFYVFVIILVTVPFTAQKCFSLKTSLVNMKTADLVTFIEEFLDGKLQFLCSVIVVNVNSFRANV